MKLKLSTEPARILDFDVETVAAGFADPNWVPQKITCVAFSWIGEEKVTSHICTTKGLYEKPDLRAYMLSKLIAEIRKADMVTGHNLIRFDLPVVNAECLRLGIEPLGEVLVQDTMRLVRAKGFKKGQDNIGQLLKLPAEKQSMTWQQWQDGYEEPNWKTIRSRCESDVLMHKQMRTRLLELGWLKPPKRWSS
jgi:DNA polymerase elongation subunit (family B)